MKTRMTVHHLGEQRYVGMNDRGQQLLIDASPVAVGVRPMEALLGAVATCIMFDVTGILEKRRTPARSYRVEIEGDRADSPPKRYTAIRMRHIVSGDGIDPAALEKSVKLVHDRYCSVASSLDPDIPVELVVEVEQQAPAAD